VQWITPNGRQRFFNPAKYRINYNKPAASRLAQTFQDFVRDFASYDYWLAEFRLPSTLLRCDYINLSKKIAFEISGVQHLKYVSHFHRSRAGYRDSLIRDGKKILNLEQNGFKVIELFEEDLEYLNKKYLQDKFGVLL
jgi:hypothetical protein